LAPWIKKLSIESIVVLLFFTVIIASNTNISWKYYRDYNSFSDYHSPVHTNITNLSRSTTTVSKIFKSNEFQNSNNLIYEKGKLNVSMTWILGPGNKTSILDSKDNILAIGTNLGVNLYYLNGTRINSIYTGANITALKIINPNSGSSPELIIGTSNGSAICYTIHGEEKFSASLESTVILVNYTNVYSIYEKAFVIVTRKTINVYSTNGSLILYQTVIGEINVALTSDLDADGLNEIIVGSNTGSIYIIYRGTTFTNTFDGSIISLYASDINGDKDKEVLCGSNKGVIHILDYRGKLITQKSIASKALISLLAKDFDNDKSIEIASLDRSGFLCIMNSSLQTEWQYNFSSESLKLLSARINSSPPPELILVTFSEIHCLGFNSSSSSWDSIWNHSSKYKITDLDLVNIDIDGYDEIIYGGLSCYVVILKNDSSLLRLITYTVNGEKILSDDLDDDGNPETIITDTMGVLFLFNDSGYLIFNYSIGVKSRLILVGDINDDGTKDIILALENNTILAFNMNGTLILNYSISSDLHDAVIFDPDDDNLLEIAVATSDGVYIINSSGKLETKILENTNVTCISFGDLYSLGHDSLTAGLSNGSIISYDLPTSTIQKFDFNYGAVSDIIVDKFGFSSDNILFSTYWGYMVMMNTSKILWELSNKHGISSIGHMPRNSEIIANYLYGVLLVHYNGSVSLNMTLDNLITDTSHGDVIGNYSEELVILTADNIIEVYDYRGKNLKVLNISITQPTKIECYDDDHDFVKEIKIISLNGILLVDSIPQIQIINPANNTITNSSNILIQWVYQGFSPLLYEIYLNSILIKSVDSSYQVTNISVPSDGSWRIRLKAIPRAGESLKTSLSILVDTHSPFLSILGPRNDSYISNRTVVVKWEASDDLSGINYSEIKLDDDEWIYVGNNQSFTFKNLSYGSHQIKIRTIDNAGNMNITNIVIHIDDVPPTTLIKTPINNTYLNHSTINIEWGYNEDNLDTFKLYIDGNLVYNGTDTNYTVSGLKDGNHSIVLICIDLAKNSAEEVIFVTIDTVAPSIKIVSPSNKTYTNESLMKIKLEINDTNLDKIILSLNGSKYIDYGLNKTIGVSFDEEGYYILTIFAYDKALNMNSTKLIALVDFTEPVILVDYPLNNTYLNISSFIVKWRGYDNLSGIKSYEIIVDSEAFINVGSSTEFEVTGLNDGFHTIRIRAIDKSGNSVCVKIVVIVDNVNPIVEILSPSNGTITNSSLITVEIDFIEQNTKYIALFINDSFQGYIENNSCLIKLSEDGYYAIRIKIVDLAGNSDETKIIILYDNTPPILLIPEYFNNTVLTNSSIIIKWHGIDNLSGITRYLISIDNGTFIDIGLNEWYLVDLSDLSVGKHVIEIKAIDLAGNSIAKIIYFYKEITVKPKEEFPLTQVIIATVILTFLAAIDAYVLFIRRKNQNNQ